MEPLQHLSHEHPLVFNVEPIHQSDQKPHCSGCGELVSGPSFSCVACVFYLDKQCAEAPYEMKHPFHPADRFMLLKWPPHWEGLLCYFCNKTCENFVYRCSCGLGLHIKCALFSYNIAEKGIGALQHIARIDPLIFTENHEELRNAKCFACWKLLLDSEYLSPDCGFYLHVKCVDLRAEINHLLHHEHPLILQFNSQRLSCKICQKTQRGGGGFVYCCSSCKFVLHIGCATVTIPTKINLPYHRKHPLILQLVNESLPCRICQKTLLNSAAYFCSICKFVLHTGCVSTMPSIEDKIHHEHTFTLLQGHVSFTCNACGTLGNCVAYICSICNLIVHKNCISLPRIIQFFAHHHHIFHNYFLEQNDLKTGDCRICHEEVNTEHGSYFCSKCNYIVHVNCALEDDDYYYVVHSMEIDVVDMDLALSIDEPMDSRENVTATGMKHFSHQHNLALSEDAKDDKQCDGCLLSISDTYYYCSQCDFFLHKSCAELPLKKHIWFHYHQKPHRLTSDGIFKCQRCGYETSGFGYYCEECKGRFCLRCALVSDIAICQGHEHHLPFYLKYEGLCNACGDSIIGAYSCKSCSFTLDHRCLTLPHIARHKFDEHPFTLTYHNNNNHPECHYCDICGKERNPNHWFYHCAICAHSAHPKCVLGKYSLIKQGSIYTKGDHPHPLTFVEKVHYHPDCHRCGKPCLDLSLECIEIGCNYIVHWECIKPDDLKAKVLELTCCIL